MTPSVPIFLTRIKRACFQFLKLPRVPSAKMWPVWLEQIIKADLWVICLHLVSVSFEGTEAATVLPLSLFGGPSVRCALGGTHQLASRQSVGPRLFLFSPPSEFTRPLRGCSQLQPGTGYSRI